MESSIANTGSVCNGETWEEDTRYVPGKKPENPVPKQEELAVQQAALWERFGCRIIFNRSLVLLGNGSHWFFRVFCKKCMPFL